MKTVIVVRPRGGWRYGFPKTLPPEDDVVWTNKQHLNFKEKLVWWLRYQNYPDWLIKSIGDLNNILEFNQV